MVSKIRPSSKSLNSMDRAMRAARVWAFPWAAQGQGLPPLEADGKMTTSDDSDDSVGFPSHLKRFLGLRKSWYNDSLPTFLLPPPPEPLTRW